MRGLPAGSTERVLPTAKSLLASLVVVRACESLASARGGDQHVAILQRMFAGDWPRAFPARLPVAYSVDDSPLMPLILRWFAILSLALAAGAGLPQEGRGQADPPLVAVGSAESRLLADAADGSLDRQSLFRASLVAGGVADDAELNFWQQRFDALCESLDAKHTDESRFTPQELFAFLHSQILTGHYQASVTTLPETLRSGNYNCLTATILFISIGERYGVPIEAVSTSGHIYCRLPDNGPLDIETTQPDWDKARNVQSAVSEENRRLPSRCINHVQVVAKIYYNRGLELLGRKQFEPAVSLLQRSLRLDPQDADARENLLAAYNNWALFLAEGERFAEAADLLRRGQELDASYPPYRANYLHVYQRWAAWHCARHEYASAIDVLERGSRNHPDAPLFITGPRTVYAQWLEWHLKRGEYQRAAEVLAAANRRLDQDAIARLQAHVQLTIED